jgi:hypothetical protein
MVRTLVVCLLLTVSASAIQQSCTAKAEDCKDPVTNPKHYEDRHCTCFTCQSGTAEQKVLCANDDDAVRHLQARVEAPQEKSIRATGDVQSTIQSAIQKDPSLASANVTVDVKNGKSVDLTGKVPSKDAKDEAERIAKENSGGLKVKNHLKVAGITDTTSDKPKSDMSNPKP